MPNPQQHSTELVLGSTGLTPRSVSLPWTCSALTVVNDSTGARAYVRLSSGDASTDDWPLKAGESQTWAIPTSSLSLLSTTTSTAATARVGAWRW